MHSNFREKHSCHSYCDIFYSNGQPHGFYRKFCVDKNFEELGYFIDGAKSIGEFCRKCDGNSYLIANQRQREYSAVADESNENEDEYILVDCTYVYPDVKSAISGSFKFRSRIRDAKNQKRNENEKSNDDIKLYKGMYGKITSISWSGNGFPVPNVTPMCEAVFSYDPSTGLRIR